MGKLPYILFAVALLGFVGMILFKAYGGGGAPALDLKASIAKAKKLQEAGDYTKAGEELDKVIKAADENPGLKGTIGFVKVQEIKALNFYKQQKFSEAEALYKETSDFYEKKNDPALMDDFGLMLNRLALTYHAMAAKGKNAEGKFEAVNSMKAEESFKKSLDVLGKAKTDESNVVMVKENLGVFYREAQKNTEAEPLLKETLAYRDSSKAADDKVNFARQNLGAVLARSDDKAKIGQGIELLEKVLEYYKVNKKMGYYKETIELLVEASAKGADKARSEKYMKIMKDIEDQLNKKTTAPAAKP